jgi:hypothetical protein
MGFISFSNPPAKAFMIPPPYGEKAAGDMKLAAGAP